MHVYNTDPKVLERTLETRRSNLRQDLCQKTHLSHEQIEGWFIYIRNKVDVVLWFRILLRIELMRFEIYFLFVILLTLYVFPIYSPD